jgi:hypothetical protein
VSALSAASEVLEDIVAVLAGGLVDQDARTIASVPPRRPALQLGGEPHLLVERCFDEVVQGICAPPVHRSVRRLPMFLMVSGLLITILVIVAIIALVLYILRGRIVR